MRDAFQISWINMKGYACLPSCLIDPAVKKIQLDQVTPIVVTLGWAHSLGTLSFCKCQ